MNQINSNSPVNSTESTSVPKPRHIPEAYKKLAQGLEKQFIELMLKEMDKTKGTVKKPDPAMNYYQSLLMEKRAELMSLHNGGVGIQKLILDQIYPNKE